MAQEPLNDLARSNIGVVIAFLRSVGHSLEADNIQAWLDGGKITMDEDLGDDTGAETDGDGNIVIRKLDLATVDLSRAPRLRLFSAIADLAALLVHEKVHAHQNAPNLILEIRFKLSTSTNIWELEAYYREIDVRVEWMRWLVGEYVDEVRIYNPKVRAFNELARAIAAGEPAQKERMLELLGPIRAETDELMQKKQNIIDMIREILGRARVLKNANYEKQNYWYDQMKQGWEAYLAQWQDNVRTLGLNRERGADWAEWIRQDPPPLPELLLEMPERAMLDTQDLRSRYAAVLAQREAWERRPPAQEVAHVTPFVEPLVAELPPDGLANLLVYPDVSYRVYYHRREVPIGLDVRGGRIADANLRGFDAAGTTVRVAQSTMLRVLAAADPAAAYRAERAAGRIQFEPRAAGGRRPVLYLIAVVVGLALGFALARLF